MNYQRLTLALLLCATQWLGGQTPDPFSLRTKQESQERARQMARDLVSGILEVQLEQLEENGLTTLPVYRDIQLMRDNLNGLIETEMARVIDLLVRAQASEPRSQETLFAEARKVIREVVLSLSLERHNLLRRLKTAELATQVKRLIALESAALNLTVSLPAMPKERQETLVLSAVQDQRDVKALFLHLVQALGEVSSWGGTAGVGASDGLRILKAGRVSDELDQAGSNLESAEFTSAASSQRQALKGLRLLLEKIEETQGLIGADRDAALETVRALIRREEALRDLTRTADLSEGQGEKLVDEQIAVHKELARLEDSLSSLPTTDDMLRAARAAALEASGKLFEARRNDALREESKVIGSLAQIEEELKSAAADHDASRTAEELARTVEALKETERDLEAAKSFHDKTAEVARSAPGDAARSEGEAARKAAQAGGRRETPPAVTARSVEASQAAKDAAEALARTSQADESARTEAPGIAGAIERSGEAIERALAEARAARKDAERRQLAVEIGELARAAESLERAAGAERDSGATPASAASETARVAGDVRDIARKAAEGLGFTSPEIARELAKSSEKAPPSAADLARAASGLRREIGEAASKLLALSETQLAEVEKPRQEVESMILGNEDSQSDRLGQLLAAREKASQAAMEAERGRGRQGAADALAQAGKIEEARRVADAVRRRTQELAEGRASSALDVASLAQSAADQAAEALKAMAAPAESSQEPVSETAQSLEAARDASSRAAKGLFDGNLSQALIASDEAARSFARAEGAAEATRKLAAQAPPGPLDAAAQARAASLAREAAQLSARDAAKASAAFAQASEAAAGASSLTHQESSAKQSALAEEAAGAIATGADQLRQAMEDLSRRESEALRATGAQAGKLAPGVADVDPGAAAALRSAAQAGARASGQEERSSAAAAPRGDAVRRPIERALANLSAREERIRRDRAVAEAIRALSERQERAARAIDSTRDALSAAQSAQAKGEAAGEAAAGLTQAMEEFAQAQTAMGEGAEQVSGQSEVANAPIREALEIASRLPVPGSPASPGSPDGASPDAASPAPAQPAMGSSFVPGSPEGTAASLAGARALAQAAQAMGAEGKTGNGQGKGKGEGQSQGKSEGKGEGKGQAKGEGKQGSQGKGNASSKGGDPTQNAAVKDGALAKEAARAATDSRAAGGGGDAGGGNSAREEPWLLKLSPELRAAIRSQARRPPPRGYEERLRRYFESIDS